MRLWEYLGKPVTLESITGLKKESELDRMIQEAETELIQRDIKAARGGT